MSTFKTRYTVENVPWYWRAPMELYGWGVAIPFYLYTCLVVVTSRVTYTGYQPQPGKNYSYCFWHESIFAYMCLSLRMPDIALFVHPVWYMRPSHVLGYLKGVRAVIYGSTGNHGRESAELLAMRVRAGDSAFFTPDGPYGPLRKMKRGALFVAASSGVPVVGMKISSCFNFKLNGWDRKTVPLPFGRLQVEYGQPVTVTEEGIDEAQARVAALMNAQPCSMSPRSE